MPLPPRAGSAKRPHGLDIGPGSLHLDVIGAAGRCGQSEAQYGELHGDRAFALEIFMFRERLTLPALLALSCIMLFGALGCDAGPRPPDRDGGGADAMGPSMCIPGMPGFRCMGNEAVECLPDGSDGMRTNCVMAGRVCVEGIGCTVCRPNAFQCNGNDVERCNGTGTAWEPHASCDATAGQMCNSVSGSCASACDDAAASNSYIGCEYWPTPAANFVSTEFDFAVVVANPGGAIANVTVTRGGAPVMTVPVPANGLETIRLPWVDAYKIPFNEGGGIFGPPPEIRSALVRGGAYRLNSTLPVTVYQFNPLEFRVNRDCPDEDPFSPTFGDGQCFSFTNDASLLLPTHVLTGNYIAVSERTRAVSCTPGDVNSTPGFVTIVGASDTPVTVTVQLRGRVAQSEDGSISAGGPGDTQMYTLNAGDVIQLASAAVPTCTPGGTTEGQCGGTDMTHCRVSDEYDLTGTEIRATGPVMVLGGHACAFLPFNRFACDHIEETVFPLEAWGRDFIVSRTESLRGEPNIVRVLSGQDGNMITFDPAGTQPAATLNRGQVLEFETTTDFRVAGSGPILVSQYLVGQNYDGGIATDSVGDPAMSFAVPTEQFRTEYTFLAPETFTRSFVNVVAPDGVDVMLSSGGGAPTAVGGWTNVGGTGMRAARVEIPGGQHVITSSAPFGIVVYGYAQYTSYMYPGGLDFEEINPLI